MAAVELDPIFVKALKLLHSKAKDSAAQLKQMVEDSIAQKKGRSRDNSPKPSLIIPKSSYGVTASKPDFDEIRKREIEKRNFEKVSKDLSEFAQSPEPKKPKLEAKPFAEMKKDDHKVKTSKDKDFVLKDKFDDKYEKKLKMESTKPEPKPERKRIIVQEDDSSSSDDLGMDADDFAVDMGIACVVCRQFDSTAANQLVECQECHSLYHQQCHKPSVSSQDVNDPRFVWYCSRCQKNMKKIVTTKPQKMKPTTPSASSSSAGSFLALKESGGTTKSTSSLSSRPSPTETPFQAFKRLAEAKAAGSSSSGGTKPFVGLAGLAANLSTSKSSKISDTKSSKSFDSLKFGSKTTDSIKSKPTELSKTGKSSSSGGMVKSSSGTGLAKLASSVSSSSTSTKSVSSSSNSGKSSASQLSRSNSGGASQAMAAEKKLQMMKKKAAAKLQERRK